MPDEPTPKSKVHPHKWDGYRPPGRRPRVPRAVRAGSEVAFAELCCASNFTFLTGASHPDELAARAAELGHAAVGIADANSLAGVVRGHVAAGKLGVPFVVGCRLVLDGVSLYAWPTCVASYGRLCRLLTLGKRRAAKGQCHLTPADLPEHADGLLAALDPPAVIDATCAARARALRGVFGDRLFVVLSRDYGPDDEQRLRDLSRLAGDLRAPTLASNRPLYHVPGRRLLQDVVTCVRLGRTLDDAGPLLEPAAERHLKSPEEMARMFRRHPDAIARTTEVADRCAAFSLDQLRYQYPAEVVPAGVTAMGHLRGLAHKGLARRFPRGVPERVRRQFGHELTLIGELDLPHYFLTVEDLVRWSRGQGILCQGRGAAANSVVCYALGITDADPTRINTLFERFVSRARDEPPDIDVDFEHERREEAIQYLYRKYGRDRAALCANVITYRGRSAVREVGKALGLGGDAIDRLAKGINWWKNGPVGEEELAAQKLDPADPTTRHLVHLSQLVQGFPRHLGQHPGGFVLTRTPLCELVPVGNAAMPDRTAIEWDKDDIDALGFIKVDVLGLGMLTCMAKGFDLLRRHAGVDLTLGSVPEDDAATFDMICAADTMGTFQIESRAQMSMLPRLRPRCFYDLVIEVAIVRPGPIQGGMVHPFLRRRNGEEPVPAKSGKAVDWILEKTLGVPLFQEQAMLMAVHCAGFTPDEADQLRRAVTGFRRFGDIDDFERKIVDGMVAHGYGRAFAQRCFEQIQGFSTYGFPESHAASFALIAYASAYFKCHWPGVFLCAILNSQPMGFYRPAQLVADARRHGVRVLPVDAMRSEWDCTLPVPGDPTTVRLGLNRVKGLGEAEAAKLARGRRADMRTIEHLWRATGCAARTMQCLARADAFAGLGLDRQSAVWHAGKLRDDDAPLFDHAREAEGAVSLPTLPPLRHVLADYARTGLSLKGHPMRFLRGDLAARGVVTADRLADADRYPSGRGVAVAGVCLVRQRPGSARSITFMTIEDETGMSNLVVYPIVFERCKRVARDAVAMLVRGRIDRQGQVVHVVAATFESLDDRLAELRDSSRNFR